MSLRRRAVPPPARPREELGTYVWVENGKAPVAPLESRLESGSEMEGKIELDPEVEEHLAYVCHHPGFKREVEELRRRHARPHTIARSAARWRVSFGTMRSFVDADSDVVELNALDDVVFVEARPSAYVIWVPRPTTRRRREAVSKWLQAEWRAPELHGYVEGWTEAGKSSHAPGRVAALDWLDRWIDGESVTELHDSLPVGERRKTTEDAMRQSMRRAFAQLRRISPEGLPEHGP